MLLVRLVCAADDETVLDDWEWSRGELAPFNPWLMLENDGVNLRVGMLRPKRRP